MKKQTWQTSKYQQRLFYPMDGIKEKYGKEIADFIATLPKQQQQIAYLTAENVSYELALCMGRKFLKNSTP